MRMVNHEPDDTSRFLCTAAEMIKVGVIRDIIREAGISREEWNSL